MRFAKPALGRSILPTSLLGVVVILSLLRSAGHQFTHLGWTEAHCGHGIHKLGQHIDMLLRHSLLLPQLCIRLFQPLKPSLLQLLHVHPQHAVNMSSPSVLELCLVAVLVHTHGTVLGHHDLPDECLHSLVKAPREAEHILPDILMTTLVGILLQELRQRHPHATCQGLDLDMASHSLQLLFVLEAVSAVSQLQAFISQGFADRLLPPQVSTTESPEALKATQVVDVCVHLVSRFQPVPRRLLHIVQDTECIVPMQSSLAVFSNHLPSSPALHVQVAHYLLQLHVCHGKIDI